MPKRHPLRPIRTMGNKALAVLGGEFEERYSLPFPRLGQNVGRSSSFFIHRPLPPPPIYHKMASAQPYPPKATKQNIALISRLETTVR